MAGPIDKVAWIRIEGGRILGARSRGKDVCYLPGGKREAGETDLDTLVREIGEELSVAIVRESGRFAGVFEARAHGHTEGLSVRMSCYEADYRGDLAPSGEVEEVVWLAYGDRHRVSPVVRLIFDSLRAEGRLA
ncbi:NUDIX hydrolase [Streptosporangium roseum]|uniref:NUDIX hydrolase n=1 Tax=Streptosporangium roseum TaxID=2001 RepID=UPI003323D8A2